jgi:hypothetical protein
MTTPILPTRTQLAQLAFSPSQLILDKEVETFLTVTNNYRFLLALMAAFRSGISQTTTYNSATQTGTNTSVIYRDVTAHIELLVRYLTDPQYGYTYTVSAHNGTAWTAITSGSGTPILVNGNASGDSFILVAWA